MPNLLKEFRDKRKMSQDRLAEECDFDITQFRISQIERGEKDPTEEEKIAIASVIDLPPRVIFPHCEDEKAAAPPEDSLPETVGDPEGEEDDETKVWPPSDVPVSGLRIEAADDYDTKEILESVECFASRMVEVLNKHKDEKDGWKEEKLSFFVDRLKEEYEEVQEAIMEIDERTLYKELIDMANICMMACEVLATRKNSRASL